MKNKILYVIIFILAIICIIQYFDLKNKEKEIVAKFEVIDCCSKCFKTK